MMEIDSNYLVKLLILGAVFFLPFFIEISYVTLTIAFILFIRQMIIEKKNIIANFLSNSLDCTIALFFALVIITSVLNLPQSYISYNFQKFSNGIMISLNATMLYFMFRTLSKEDRSLTTNFIWVLASQGIILAIYSIYQYLNNITMSGRVFAFFDNPNMLANYCLITIMLNVVIMLNECKFQQKVFIGFSTLFMFICFLLTFSRGTWLGFLVAMLTLTLLTNRRLFYSFLGSLILAPFFLPSSIIQRFTSISNLSDFSILQRFHIWKSGWEMFKDHLLIGIGYGQFRDLYPLYKDTLAPLNEIAVHAHNMFFHKFVEMGIIGGGTFLLVFFFFFRNVIFYLVKNDSGSERIVLVAGLCAVLGISIHGLWEENFHDYGTYFLVWSIMGMINGIGERSVECSIEKDLEPTL